MIIPATITLKELKEKISAIPRIELAVLPTPLHEVPRFSKALGGPRIFIKRDDLTALAFGGNKTRMFEFLLAQAREEGADTIIGGAGVQSNYSRQLVAACNASGFEVHLVLRRIRGKKDDAIQGNLLLDLLAGASIHMINAAPEEQRKAMYDLAEELRRKGRHPLVVRMANDEDLSPDVIAYTNCFCEKLLSSAMNWEFSRLIYTVLLMTVLRRGSSWEKQHWAARSVFWESLPRTGVMVLLIWSLATQIRPLRRSAFLVAWTRTMFLIQKTTWEKVTGL